MNKQRLPLIAGNWKLNCGGLSAGALAKNVARLSAGFEGVEVVVAPPFTALAWVHDVLKGTHVALGAQNLYPKDSGAFTGEVSAPMLRDAGCAWVILGHSERRRYFGETDEGVSLKIAAAFGRGLRPIACIGETLEEREAGRTLDVVLRQLRAFADHLLASPGTAVIAYEPVWAIGTGRVATPEQVQEVHAALRQELRRLGADLGDATRLLYGGSVDAKNAANLLACEDVDGALVGGVSLKPDDFCSIVRAAARPAEQI